MRNMLVMGLLLAVGLSVGCQKNKTTVEPVPMPLSSAGSADNHGLQSEPVEVQQVGISSGPASPQPMTPNNGYVPSAQSPYIELPAVSAPNQAMAGEVIEQPVEGSISRQPGEPLANVAPGAYTSSKTADVAPLPTYQPAVSQPVAPEPVASVDRSSSVHVVAKGETLWRIAKKYYGSGKRWIDIANANGLSDPNRIYVGMQLTIPR